MTTPADDARDMFTHADDALLDAILEGEDVASSHHALSALLADVRTICSAPSPAPSAALTELFATGAPVSLAEATLAASSHRFAGFVARLAGLTAVTKAALVAVAAGAAITTAGVTHNLPGSTQRLFENVVDTVTPWTVRHQHATPSQQAPVVPPFSTPDGPGSAPASAPPVQLPPVASSASVPPGVPPTPPVATGRPSAPPTSPSVQHPTPPVQVPTPPPSPSRSVGPPVIGPRR